MALIETVGLCHGYSGRQVLRNINLRVEKGEVFALIGPTGAGKTTLLRLIDLLERPSAGRIYFDGVDVTKAGWSHLAVRRRLAFVLQKPVVFNLSVYDNIACGLKWRRKKKEEVGEKVNHLLELVKLTHLRDKNARALSGGEVQRIAIARAVASEPEVLLLDEPTANLDPLSTIEMEELIQSIFRQYQTTIIMATHDLAQGRRLAHRISVMVKGEIVQTGKADEIFGSPLNQEVAEFVGIENIIGGIITAKDGEVVTIDIEGRLIEAISDYAVGDAVYACIRSEDVTLASARAISSARNSLVGEITSVKVRGSLAHVEVNCGFPLVALVTKRSAQELAFESGGRVYVSFKATAVHVIKKR